MEKNQQEQEKSNPSLAGSSAMEETVTQQPQENKQFSEFDGYTPNENEKHLYHVAMEQPQYDRKTGKKLSKPFVQMFSVPEYKQLTKVDGKNPNYAEQLGYSIKVLWDPTANV